MHEVEQACARRGVPLHHVISDAGRQATIIKRRSYGKLAFTYVAIRRPSSHARLFRSSRHQIAHRYRDSISEADRNKRPQ